MLSCNNRNEYSYQILPRIRSNPRSVSTVKGDEWRAIEFQWKFENFCRDSDKRYAFESLGRNCNRAWGERKKESTDAFTSPSKWYNKIGKLYCISESDGQASSTFTRTNIYIALTVLFINGSFSVFAPYTLEAGGKGRNWGFYIKKKICILYFIRW